MRYYRTRFNDFSIIENSYSEGIIESRDTIRDYLYNVRLDRVVIGGRALSPNSATINSLGQFNSMFSYAVEILH